MKEAPATSARKLRARAEEKSCQSEYPASCTLSTEETDKLIHELRVHQIELEMQNEELRRTQHTLDTERLRYFDLYDMAPIGYLTVNKLGVITETNRAITIMLGIQRHKLLTRRLSQFIRPEDQDSYYLRHKQGGKTGEIQSWNMRLMRTDGSLFWAHLLATPAPEGDYWITCHDISGSVQLEEEKLALEQKLQQAQKLESLGVLAGGIAHDFNNILAIIIGYCSLIKKDYTTAADFIPAIGKAAERASALCRQMLAYAGKSVSSLSEINVVTLVDEMVKMLSSALNENVTITLDCQADIPAITGDASQIRQIVMNLIINASEAIGDAHGEIYVSVARVAISSTHPTRDHLGKTITPGKYVCLEVTDNGCGMNIETKRRVFEPFYTTKFKGRGLGMSAVLGILTAHKGVLQLTSQPDRGTTFKICLPVETGDSGDVESTQHQRPTRWRGSGTVLLVENEVEVILLMSAMLTKMGFTVIEALNGAEALELYRKKSGDITMVVMDIGMPVMDGYELFHELKKLTSDLPIIISSGFSETVITSRIPRSNIAALISKPFDFNQLQDEMKNVLEKITRKRV